MCIRDSTLDGVTFSVQKVLAADEAENLSEAVLVTTADGGKIETKYVTAGTYVIREVSTLPGYLLDTKERYFTVDEEGFIFESDSEGRPPVSYTHLVLAWSIKSGAGILPSNLI